MEEWEAGVRGSKPGVAYRGLRPPACGGTQPDAVSGGSREAPSLWEQGGRRASRARAPPSKPAPAPAPPTPAHKVKDPCVPFKPSPGTTNRLKRGTMGPQADPPERTSKVCVSLIHAAKQTANTKKQAHKQAPRPAARPARFLGECLKFKKINFFFPPEILCIYLRHQQREERVGGDVEGDAQAQVAGALVHLAAELALRHVELRRMEGRVLWKEGFYRRKEYFWSVLLGFGV